MECKLYMYINNWCALCHENASSSVASAMNLDGEIYLIYILFLSHLSGGAR